MFSLRWELFELLMGRMIFSAGDIANAYSVQRYYINLDAQTGIGLTKRIIYYCCLMLK